MLKILQRISSQQEESQVLRHEIPAASAPVKLAISFFFFFFFLIFIPSFYFHVLLFFVFSSLVRLDGCAGSEQVDCWHGDPLPQGEEQEELPPSLHFVVVYFLFYFVLFYFIFFYVLRVFVSLNCSLIPHRLRWGTSRSFLFACFLF